MFKSKLNPEVTAETLKGRVWIGVFMLAIWLVFLWWAGITFPFVGHETSGQNIVYGVIVGLPFLVLMTLYMALAVKDVKEAVAALKALSGKKGK